MKQERKQAGKKKRGEIESHIEISNTEFISNW